MNRIKIVSRVPVGQYLTPQDVNIIDLDTGETIPNILSFEYKVNVNTASPTIVIEFVPQEVVFDEINLSTIPSVQLNRDVRQIREI